MSPDSTKVFVTGYTTIAAGGVTGVATVAYGADTGTQLWANVYRAPGTQFSSGEALAVSPNGSTLFVTGDAAASNGTSSYLTLAYNANTGAHTWNRAYANHGASNLIGLSPDGSTVFVSGSVRAPKADREIETVAYRAATGERLWVDRYELPGNPRSGPAGLVVSPDGTKVYVAGQIMYKWKEFFDFITLAYDTHSGTRIWTAGGVGKAVGDEAMATAIAVGPNGSRVYVTGTDIMKGDWTTIAYNAITGARIWTRTYNGLPNDLGFGGEALAVTPDGSKIVLMGSTGESEWVANYFVAVYNTSGTMLWKSTYNGPDNGVDYAKSLALSPDGTRAYVTGMSGKPGRDRLRLRDRRVQLELRSGEDAPAEAADADVREGNRESDDCAVDRPCVHVWDVGHSHPHPLAHVDERVDEHRGLQPRDRSQVGPRVVGRAEHGHREHQDAEDQRHLTRLDRVPTVSPSAPARRQDSGTIVISTGQLNVKCTGVEGTM